ncbi:MAG: ATP-binding protein [Gammaproteobacteria bacterium]|nr:ATP-binding protein [Gammaproteobacteria bacterium]
MIIGRDKEQKLLNKAFLSNESEFIVVYGRRRVGKTYLVREFFENKKCLFIHATGTRKDSMRVQLERFLEAVSTTFFSGAPLKTTSWSEAFSILNQQLINHPNKKIVIFLDELPWLATPRSRLLQHIDYYWNHHWSKLKNIILVVCGSSASWLLNNIIYDKGGLHNRVTIEMRLMPFNLYETKAFLRYKKIKLNHRHILTLYMALGGIPYYLNYIETGLSAEQNIQAILFDTSSPLKNEFSKLYRSLFDHSETYLEIVTLLSTHKGGLTRAEIERQATLSTNGGRLTERLRNLSESGFIEERVSWGKKIGEYYKLIDEFTLFQLHWMNQHKRQKYTRDHWIAQSNSQSYKAWAGYAFESVCMKHIDQIVAALNITSGITIDSWRFIPKGLLEEGAQIDLLIDRNDSAITLCEIKFTQEPFVIDKPYAKNLQRKLALFKAKTKTEKQLFLVMISAAGIRPTLYAEELVSAVVTLDQLFIL